MELKPSKELERGLDDIHQAFSGVMYWHCFGGLYAICNNGGVVPDGDLDACVMYGTDWKRIARAFESRGWTRGKVVLDDRNNGNAVFMGVERRDIGIYLCISFWYRWNEFFFWCHDEKMEVAPNEIGTPSGYWFKGCPARLLDSESKFIMVEWPGISQRVRVRVPLLSGELLDLMYPGWPYRLQRYNVENNQYEPEKTISINDPIYQRGGINVHAISPYRVHIKSMADWSDEAAIRKQLDESRQGFDKGLEGRYRK